MSEALERIHTDEDDYGLLVADETAEGDLLSLGVVDIERGGFGNGVGSGQGGVCGGHGRWSGPLRNSVRKEVTMVIT